MSDPDITSTITEARRWAKELRRSAAALAKAGEHVAAAGTSTVAALLERQADIICACLDEITGRTGHEDWG